MPLFTLTPASLAWSPLFAGYYSYLTGSVTALRVKTGVMAGSGTMAIHSTQFGKDLNEHDRARDEKKLLVLSRAHANFSESVPLSYLFIVLAELNGAPTYLIHTALGLLFSFRVAHVELGMKGPHAESLGRPLGAYGTVILTFATAAYNFNLGYENLKSFVGI